jgi:hypothetical protein
MPNKMKKQIKIEREYQVLGDDRRLSALSQYDEKGNKVYEESYNPDMSIYSATTYSYTPEGKIAKETMQGEFEEDQQSLEFHYDEKGRITLLKTIYADDSFEAEETIYQADGTVVMKKLDTEGECYETTILHFNDKELLIKKEARGLDENVTTEYFYNEEKHLIERKRYDEEGELFERLELSYNEEGLLEKEDSYDAEDECLFEHFISYKDGQKVTEIFFDHSLEKYFRYEREYDANGLLLDELEFHSETGEPVASVQYTYNEEGHTVRVMSVDGTATSRSQLGAGVVKEFELEYYG